MLRRTLLVMIVLTACAPRNAGEQSVGPMLAGIRAAAFTDSDPHDWQGRAPSAYPVHGIDLSKFQTSVDWAAARAGGVNFAYIKATEGGDQVDPLFATHWRNAGAARVMRGAYHFYYHCRPAIEQARYFIANVPRTAGALPPVLDMEWTPRSPTCRIRRDAETIRADARIFLNAIEAHYGTRPILYTAIDFFEDNQLWRLQGVDFWLRSTAAHPSDLYKGQDWSFWQYSGTGKVGGLGTHVDLNAFAGSSSDWTDWVARRAQH